jgi:hypothetical protein
MDDLYDRYSHLLQSLDLIWLDPELFATVIHDKGAPLKQCRGFIDDIPRPMARPTTMYSGHKNITLYNIPGQYIIDYL